MSNAGANYFEDRCDLSSLHEINWEAVYTDKWGGPGIPSSIKEGKQAEFLMEDHFPWHLIERIGVQSNEIYQIVADAVFSDSSKPKIEIKPEWYYR